MRISDWSSDVCSSDLMARQDRGKGSRRHRLAGMEANVLANVSEVGGDEPDPASAQIARGVGCEQQRQQLGVRMIETAQQDDVAVADVAYDPEIGFTVGTLTMLDPSALCLECGGKRLCPGLAAHNPPQHGTVTSLYLPNNAHPP